MVNAPQAVYALIGCGPRGLNVLERFIFHANRDPLRRPAVLHIIDPGGPGAGIHHAQPHYLLLNTIATQLTAFVDGEMIDNGGVRGPSLYEWARRCGVVVTSNTGEVRPVRPTDHLPRRLLGEYLGWAFRQLLAECPHWLDVQMHYSAAIAVRQLPSGREQVTMDDGTTVDVDGVVLCVGHAGTRARGPADPIVPPTAWIANPYSTSRPLAGVRAGETVGILGGGLTAMDVIAEFTAGRGGRYETSEHGLRYVPSGDEPDIVLITRSGLPSRARPRPYRSGAIAQRHLTEQALDAARTRRTDGRLNFREDVLPLVHAEMRHRIRIMAEDSLEAERIEAIALAAWDAKVPTIALSTEDSYRRWFTQQVEQDLAEAHHGLDSSPLKAAFEVLRDLREVLRRSIDGGGMDEESLAYFFGHFAGEINRNVIGPQLERNDELLALVRAGVLSPGLGPATRLTRADGRWLLESTALATACTIELHHVVCGFSSAPSVSASTNPIVRQLHSAGRLRPVLCAGNELGVDVDVDGCAINDHGDAQPALFVLGPLTEGSSYYNHYVTSPNTRSRATADADRTVRSALSPLDLQVALP